MLARLPAVDVGGELPQGLTVLRTVSSIWKFLLGGKCSLWFPHRANYRMT